MSTADLHHVLEPDADVFRRAMGTLPTGVSILSTGSGPATVAMTVNSVTSVSLDPLLVLVGVRSDGRIRRHVEEMGAFGLSVLAESHAQLSSTFARRDRPTGADAARLLGRAGRRVTLLDGAVVAFECAVHSEVTCGDHVLFVGRVTHVHTPIDGNGVHRALRPLVFHAGDYREIGALVAASRAQALDHNRVPVRSGRASI